MAHTAEPFTAESLWGPTMGHMFPLPTYMSTYRKNKTLIFTPWPTPKWHAHWQHRDRKGGRRVEGGERERERWLTGQRAVVVGGGKRSQGDAAGVIHKGLLKVMCMKRLKPRRIQLQNKAFTETRLKSEGNANTSCHCICGLLCMTHCTILSRTF